VLRIVNTQEKP